MLQAIEARLDILIKNQFDDFKSHLTSVVLWTETYSFTCVSFLEMTDNVLLYFVFI